MTRMLILDTCFRLLATQRAERHHAIDQRWHEPRGFRVGCRGQERMRDPLRDRREQGADLRHRTTGCGAGEQVAQLRGVVQDRRTVLIHRDDQRAIDGGFGIRGAVVHAIEDLFKHVPGRTGSSYAR